MVGEGLMRTTSCEVGWVEQANEEWECQVMHETGYGSHEVIFKSLRELTQKYCLYIRWMVVTA